MKPSWDDAPRWAQWLAMDGDCLWFWYSSKPEWFDPDDSWNPRGAENVYAGFFESSEPAQETKERRP